MGSISKHGDRYLRGLFTVGALAVTLLARPPTKGRCGRTRQQHRADGLGHNGRGRGLQGTRRRRVAAGASRAQWRPIQATRIRLFGIDALNLLRLAMVVMK